MGIYVRDINGEMYVYILAGKKQFFIGRKDDVENINIENLLKAINEFDKTYDKQTKRYVDSILDCIKFMDKKDRKSYLSKRKIKINENLSKM